MADEEALFREEFALFDEDGSNTIDIKELGNVVRSLGFAPTEEQLAAWMAEFDANGDGVLGIDEFLRLMSVKQPARITEAQSVEAFKIFDQDGSGKLALAELRSNLVTMGEKLSEEEVAKRR